MHVICTLPQFMSVEDFRKKGLRTLSSKVKFKSSVEKSCVPFIPYSVQPPLTAKFS